METKTRKYIKGYGFLSFARKYKKQILDKGLDASKKVVYKACEFIRNNSDDDYIETQEPVKEIIIPPEKKEEILNQLRRVVWKWNTIKYLNY